ncbi:hypothetical protein Vretimale_5515 [Volvox reticuliferus]|uniref:quinolinate synthase n=2 Tax=Volvox reticuliferus TaxID=1737510 RepID=A0A8J4G5W1_9CHLO|nr:hypothetical protein Vretifemale_5572 [Volvox reticuliferus]GIM00652.1 hypothetical protein Vretimale_5515 [Volvox reticuliferus]
MRLHHSCLIRQAATTDCAHENAAVPRMCGGVPRIILQWHPYATALCRSRQVKAQSLFPPAAAALAEVHGCVSDPAAGIPKKLEALLGRLTATGDAREHMRRLLELGMALEPLPAEQQTTANRVMGCTAQVWLTARLDTATGGLQFQGWSDSEISRGLVAMIVSGLSGCTAEEVLQVPSSVLQRRLAAVLGPAVLTSGRTNGFANMIESAKKRARLLAMPDTMAVFPSLLITAEGLEPQGTFAEAQARYLRPDQQQVSQLADLLREKSIGVVAHFYMDPEVQGVLSAAGELWPHVAISDSLVMADTAVRMAEAGCRSICVLGVDFMSENVRAILDEAGHTDVQVYRLAEADIGCSLAEAAEADTYMSYLSTAAQTPNSVHVVYINTSLRTKALGHALVPTITCTSSNVVQTILTAFAQVPDAAVWYGPDTYMGRNLAQLFSDLAASASDEDVRRLHPEHTVETIRALLPRFHYFNNGTCIVHHIFGGEVAELVRTAYGDAYLAAHFEVPGEMFGLAMEAKRTRDMGVVGSTSNILDFISGKVGTALSQPNPERLQFVLGTEAGMITSIVRKVQAMLRKANRSDVEVEIVFPVAPSAITTTRQQSSSGPVQLPAGLEILPGPASGEGCSLEGGCAACPYMKMNTLNSLLRICKAIGTPGEPLLSGFKPRTYQEDRVGEKTLAAAGCVPILHMRHFQKHKTFSGELLQDITTRVR